MQSWKIAIWTRSVGSNLSISSSRAGSDDQRSAWWRTESWSRTLSTSGSVFAWPLIRPRMPAEPPQCWSRAQRALHWSIAAFILLAAPIGAYMVTLPFQQLLLKFVLYQLHKTIGITVFLLVLAQLT